jgi:hypothetical protein
MLCDHIVVLRSMLRLLVTANVPSSPILVILTMEAMERQVLQEPRGVQSQKTA